MKLTKNKKPKAIPQVMPCLVYKQSEFNKLNLLETTKVLKGEKEIKTYLTCRKGKIAAMYNIVVLKDTEENLEEGEDHEPEN